MQYFDSLLEEDNTMEKKLERNMLEEDNTMEKKARKQART